MRPFRLLRWSGSIFSPPLRPCNFYPSFPLYPSAIRLQSAAAASLLERSPASDDMTLNVITPPSSPQDLSKLPSPPPSRASSSAKLSALHARLSLPSRLPLETLSRCLIDPSADQDPSFNNDSLTILGTDLLGYYTSEIIICRYPRLPSEVVFAAMFAYCGPKTLAALTREWGVELAAAPGGEVDPGYLQCVRVEAGNADYDGTGKLVKDVPKARSKGWSLGATSQKVAEEGYNEISYRENHEARDEEARRLATRPVTLERASTNFVRALFGAIYLHCGKKATKLFFNEHIVSRHLDFSKMFDFKMPTRDLSRLCAREGLENPTARILSETGRRTRHPVFIVGIFSGRDKLGEGTGGSLDEARVRAAVAALKGWYLYSPLTLRVPSEAEGDGKAWEPLMVDCGEVVI